MVLVRLASRQVRSPVTLVRSKKKLIRCGQSLVVDCGERLKEHG